MAKKAAATKSSASTLHGSGVTTGKSKLGAAKRAAVVKKATSRVRTSSSGAIKAVRH